MLRAFLGYRKPNAKLVSTIIDHVNRTSELIKTDAQEKDGIVQLVCDFHVLGGEEWDRAVKSNIDESDLMFVLVTSELVGDSSSYLTTIEIPRAESAGIPIVPIVYEGVLSQLDLHPIARWHAIPDGGQPPSRLGGEARWMERLVASIDKRCIALLKQRKFTENDAVVATLSKVHDLTVSCEGLFGSAGGAALHAPVARVLALIKRIVRAPSHSLIPVLRAASDQVKLLRISFADQEHFSSALGELQLTLDDAWSHALLADFPTPGPVSDDGLDPIVTNGTIDAISIQLRQDMRGVRAGVKEVRQATDEVENQLLKKLTAYGCDQVDMHNDLAGYLLDQMYVDTGLVTHIARGAFDESIVLDRTARARHIQERALIAATSRLARTTMAVLALTRQMVADAKRASGAELGTSGSTVDPPMLVEFNSNETLSYDYKSRLSERIITHLERIGLSISEARTKVVIRHAKGNLFKVIFEIRHRGLGPVQSSAEERDLDAAFNEALNVAIGWINRKRGRSRVERHERGRRRPAT